jgi:Ca2+-binding RTX toxin-like protein
MPVFDLTPALFDTLEATLNLPNVDLDFASSLDVLMSGSEASAPTVLQLSSSLIRLSQEVVVYFGLGGWEFHTVEIQVSGTGIKPVGNLDALLTAINNGLVTGALNNVAILTDGTKVLNLHMDASGYVLSSGNQSMTLQGTLPLTFTQIYDLGGMFAQAMNISNLTKAERTALFHNLDAFGINTFSIADGLNKLFSMHIDATHASIMVNGMSINLLGSFPVTFGDDLELLWQAYRQMNTLGHLDLGQLGLSVTSLNVTDAAGHVVANMKSPGDGLPLTWTENGRAFAQVLLGDNSTDNLFDSAVGAKSILAGLGGDDRLFGMDGNDHVYGGGGNDILDGGKGNDVVVGGKGNDALYGGLRADTFVFSLGDGIDHIKDFKPGIDVIEILAAATLSDLSMSQVSSGVWIKFHTINVLVNDVTIAQMAHAENFVF